MMSRRTLIMIAAGFLLGMLPFLVRPPEGMPPAAWYTAGIMAWMALWWISEVIPLAATALIPIVAFPVLGTPVAQITPSYAHPLILLFLGGFLIAQAIEKSNLHRAIAELVLRSSHGRPGHVIAAIMAATAFLSLWISNTASAMIMTPIAASVALAKPDEKPFATAMLLGVAFAATIGGMGSLIGTPPNALFAAYLEQSHGIRIGFAEWAIVGLPAVLVLLPLAWLMLTRIAFDIDPRPVSFDVTTPQSLGPDARRVAVVAAAVAAAWILRPWIAASLSGYGVAVSDAGIAVAGALALFMLPDGRGGRLLDLDHALRIRWDVLILFGGGLALAHEIEVSGLAAWIAGGVGAQQFLPLFVLALAIATVVVFIGELASNTAMAAIFLPIAGAGAAGFGADPLDLALPVALAASIGFMLPVATPPNAIVFSNEAVSRADMLKAGMPLDLIGIVVAVTIAYFLGPLVL